MSGVILPQISVVIAVRNGANFILEAVASALLQGEALGSVIVVDDGSTDGTQAIVEGIVDPRVLLLRNPASGVSSARNFGALHAKTGWLLFLDADDRLVEGAADWLLERVAESPPPVAVYGDYERINTDGNAFGKRHLMRRSRSKPSGNILPDLMSGNFIINGGVVLVSSEAFADVSGFDPGLSLCEDWHLWCKLAARGDFLYTSKRVLDYRVHTSSVMMGGRRRFEDFLPALDRVYTDPAIISKFDPTLLPGARRKAEIALMTYCAAQAYRNGFRAPGVSLAIKALVHHPRRAFYVISRFGGAMAGL